MRLCLSGLQNQMPVVCRLVQYTSSRPVVGANNYSPNPVRFWANVFGRIIIRPYGSGLSRNRFNLQIAFLSFHKLYVSYIHNTENLIVENHNSENLNLKPQLCNFCSLEANKYWLAAVNTYTYYTDCLSGCPRNDVLIQQMENLYINATS